MWNTGQDKGPKRINNHAQPGTPRNHIIPSTNGNPQEPHHLGTHAHPSVSSPGLHPQPLKSSLPCGETLPTAIYRRQQWPPHRSSITFGADVVSLPVEGVRGNAQPGATTRGLRAVGSALELFIPAEERRLRERLRVTPIQWHRKDSARGDVLDAAGRDTGDIMTLFDVPLYRRST